MSATLPEMLTQVAHSEVASRDLENLSCFTAEESEVGVGTVNTFQSFEAFERWR